MRTLRLNTTDRLLILLIGLFTLVLNACGDGSFAKHQTLSDDSARTGAVAFSVLWPDTMPESSPIRSQSPSGDVCADYGIDIIACNVYNASGNIVQSKSWSCSNHKGIMADIPTGSGMWLILDALVSGTTQWRGQSGTFTVSTNNTTNVGTVPLNYIGNDTDRPQIDTTAPADGSTRVSLNTLITAIFTEDVVTASVISAFTLTEYSIPVAGAVSYDATNRTATFTPDGALSELKTYTATIGASVEDLAGNQMTGDYVWQFTTTSIDAPYVTTAPPTLVTANSARLNALVNPIGSNTTYYFEYGTDISYGETTTPQAAGSGANPVAVLADISSLNSNTDYHFRIVSTNAGGTSNGADFVFTTDAIWAKTYGDSATNTPSCIQQTADHGYIVAGSTNVVDRDSDIWILKLDSDGTVAWAKTFGGSRTDIATSAQQTAEGGYVVAGYTDSFGSRSWWVLKLTADGKESWTRTYGGPTDEVYGESHAYSIMQTSDGGYIVAGDTRSFSASYSDFWILKLTPNGIITWQKTYGGEDWDYAKSIRQTLDGGYIVTGETQSFSHDRVYNDIWILKLNMDGSVAWQKTYGGTGRDSSAAIQQTIDGGYIVAGETDSFGAGRSDGWILKLNADGTVAWQKTYGNSYDDSIKSIQQTVDGGYIAVGKIQTFLGQYNFEDNYDDNIWILKLDAQGAIAWQKAYGEQNIDAAQFVRQTADDGYVVAGSSNWVGIGSVIRVLKLGQDGSFGCDLGVDSSAVELSSDVNGLIPDAVTIADTTATVSPIINSGRDSSAGVNTQCP